MGKFRLRHIFHFLFIPFQPARSPLPPAPSPPSSRTLPAPSRHPDPQRKRHATDERILAPGGGLTPADHAATLAVAGTSASASTAADGGKEGPRSAAAAARLWVGQSSGGAAAAAAAGGSSGDGGGSTADKPEGDAARSWRRRRGTWRRGMGSNARYS